MSAGARRARVLFVEDNDGDARLIEVELGDSGAGHPVDARFELARVTRLGDALVALAGDGSDVVLLDLNLPDSQGIETFRRVRSAAPARPIVVLSGLQDEELGVQAVREGAQDYLVKGRVDGALLARSLRFAMERAERVRIEGELEEARRVGAELGSYDRLSAPAPAAVTGATFGLRPLARAVPERFAELADRYAQLLDAALDQRAFRVDNRVGDGLRALAEEIGFLRGGPRDVVELHTAALRGRIEGANPKKAQAYVDEGRIAVLELMGHLAAYYRR